MRVGVHAHTRLVTVYECIPMCAVVICANDTCASVCVRLCVTDQAYVCACMCVGRACVNVYKSQSVCMCCVGVCVHVCLCLCFCGFFFSFSLRHIYVTEICCR